MNAIGLNMQDAFDVLLRNFSLNPAGVLFQASAPALTQAGTSITITTPAQSVAIAGGLATSRAYSETIDVTDGAGGELDLKLEIFFVSNKVGIRGVRNFFSTDPVNLATVVQNLETEFALSLEVETVYLKSFSAAAADQTPVVGPNSDGFIKLGEVIYSGGNLTYTAEDLGKFRLPAGTAIPVTNHAAQHLPGGLDELPVAEVIIGVDEFGEPTETSTIGFLPEDALLRIQETVQDIVAAANAPYLTFGTEQFGNNSKTVIADLKTDSSLSSLVSNSGPVLGVNLKPPGVLNGLSDRSARADHKHGLSESGLIVINKSIELQTGLFGTVVDTTITETDSAEDIQEILEVLYEWEPVNLDEGFSGFRMEIPWCVTSIPGAGIQTLGVRSYKRGPRDFSTEFGVAGLSYMTQAAIAAVQGRTQPVYQEGSFPRLGVLHMTVLALRGESNV